MNLSPIYLIGSIKPKKREHLLLLSAVLLGISRVFPNGSLGAYAFLALTVLIFFSSLIFGFRANPLTGVARPWYFILVVWTMILTIQVLFTGTQGLDTNFSTYFASNNMMPNLIPLTVMCYGGSRGYDIKYLFHILIVLCLVYLVYTPFVVPQVMAIGSLVQTYGIEETGEDYRSMIGASTLALSFFPGFLCLFCKKYLDRKTSILFWVACLLQLFMMLYMARRGNTVLLILNFLLLWFIYNRKKSKSLVITILKIGSIIAFIYIFWTHYDGATFSIMRERQNMDSRENMFEIFASTMSLGDWIFGRGWFGQYYETSFVGDYRSGLEVGYLHLILKGGILYLILYVMTLMISAIKGLFKSHNILCHAFGAIALIRVISLIPFGVPFFTVEEFVVWIGVFICNSAKYHKMTDNEVYQEINS